MNYEDSIKVLNGFRNRHYNDTDEELRDIAQALNVVLPQIVINNKRAKKIEELFMVSDEIIYIYELPSINIRNTRRLNELKIKLRKIKGEMEEMK